jgi:hypothetical protein
MLEARFLGVIAAVGAAMFVLIVVILTLIQWPGLQDRGWDLVRSSDVPYPSALALGPGGWLQMLNFAILGLALFAVAGGLWQVLDPRPALGIALLVVAGVAALGLVAPTDGSLSSVRTVPGAAHVGAFFTLLISLVLALLVLGWTVGDLPNWAWLRLPSLGVAIVVVLLTLISFTVPPIGGLASIASIVAMLVWLAVAAVALATASR